MPNLPIMVAVMMLFRFEQGLFQRGTVIETSRDKAEVAGDTQGLITRRCMSKALSSRFLLPEPQRPERRLVVEVEEARRSR